MILIIITLLVGLAVITLILSSYRIFAEVPKEDRTYLDRPPLSLRLVWLPLQMVAFYLGGFLPRGYKNKILAQLVQSGLDYSLSPQQFFAAKFLSAILFCWFFYFVFGHFGMHGPTAPVIGALLGFYFPNLWLGEITRKRQLSILKALPFYLDVVTLSVEAGLNLTGALNQALQKGPRGPLAFEINRVLRDIRAGKPRADALRTMSEKINLPAMTNLVGALIQAETVGSSLSTVLRAQADQRRTERFHRAEKLALEAPVKMLLPLILFIFPNTFIVLGFPIAVKMLNQGIFG